MVDKTIGPLQDAQRAIQIVRKRAAEWGINPSKIGIIGFGGLGSLGTQIALLAGAQVYVAETKVSLHRHILDAGAAAVSTTIAAFEDEALDVLESAIAHVCDEKGVVAQLV